MAQFYFHIRDGAIAFDDHTGADLLDDAAAEAFARVIANNLVAGGRHDRFYVDVRNEYDIQIAVVFVLPRA